MPFAGVSSVVESELVELFDEHKDQLVAHTNQYFVRVYPAGLRTNSGNYNPMPGLIGGCQLVALNFQTLDKYYKMYSGFFLDNGYCGYILKQLSPVPREPGMTLRVQVISGYQLGRLENEGNRDIIDPYVGVKLYGVKEDTAKFRTSTVKDNGFNPIWNDTFTFRVTRPDVALLMFVVMDENSSLKRNDFVAQYTVPVRLIRPGTSFFHHDSTWNLTFFLFIYFYHFVFF